ncbi:MAG: AsmA-like C-terminal domain-containing protein [Parvularculaceae bacterium]|nr:AsmA-like C-terminal domain-containing protein [Parvularculaceae bacterium]
MSSGPTWRVDVGALLLSGLTRGVATMLTFVVVAAALFSKGLVPLHAGLPALKAFAEEKTGARLDIGEPSLSVTGSTVWLSVPKSQLKADYDATFHDVDVFFPLGDLIRRQPKIDVLRVGAIEAFVPEPEATSSSSEPLAFEKILTQLSQGAGDVSLRRINITYGGPAPVALVDASIRAAPADDGYVINASLPFDVAGTRTAAGLDIYARPGGVTDLQLTSDGAPIQPLLLLAGVDAIRLDTSFEGQVVLSVNKEGTPIGGAFDVRLKPGSGQVGEIPFVFGQNSVNASFDGLSPRFDVKRVDYDIADNKGLLVGSVAVDNILKPAQLILDFDVAGEAIHLDLGSFMDGPLDVDRITARGTFDASMRYLGFEELTSSFFGSALSGALALTFPEGFRGNPRIEADALLPGPLTPQEVLAGWPRPLAGDARLWVEENLISGQVTNLAYKSDIPMGAIRQQTALADDTMTFTFDASKATVRYLPDMPPIRSLKASATVRGNSFRVDADRGEVSGVLLAGGYLDMPRFTPAGATATFKTQLVGEVPVVLDALEEANIVEFAEDSYQPEAFQGEGRFDLAVTWPLVAEPELDDVRVTGQGSFKQAALDNVLPGIDGVEAEGSVTLTPTRLIVRGEGLAASAPATFEWRQSLQGDQLAELSVTAEVDPVASDMIGVPLREFFEGVITTQVYASDLTPGAPLSITGDLKDADVNIPQLGLSKPEGTEGFFETTAIVPDPSGDDPLAGLIGLSNFRLTSPDFNIEGNGVFTPEGGVVRLEMPRFFIQDRADLSLRLVTDGGLLDVAMSGVHADATPLLDELFEGEGGDVGGRLPGRSNVDIELDRVSLRSDVDLRNVQLTAKHNGKDVEDLVVAALVGEDDQLSITLDRPLGEKIGFVEIESTDFGTLAQGVFGVRSIEGAPGSIKGATLVDGGFSGRFETTELIIKDAPTLARLLSIGSLDGLSDLLNGEGIRFDKLEGDVWLKDGKLGFSDTKLVGSAIGISAAGVIDLDAGTIDVRGAIAPAYAVNSVLGILPGIGRLFVSREGEGIVAFSYSLSGPLEQPTVSVNTLTALTPGILRRVFEPVENSAAGTQALLDAAIAAAREESEAPEPSPIPAPDPVPVP